MPVDQYIGGVEHAILHLLYSRFFMQALSYKNNNLKLKNHSKVYLLREWFVTKLIKIKIINWLSPDEIFSDNGRDYYNKENRSEKITVGASESMSKSKKNTIDPEQMIKNYGADSVRLFILSDSPPEKDVQWSDQGMMASYKFIQKFWILHKKLINKTGNDLFKKPIFSEPIEEFTNQIINKINIVCNIGQDIIIANLHEVYNFFNKILEEKSTKFYSAKKF